jgi:type IV pilus assembly protein PilE
MSLRRDSGFTLIELMIVVAAIAILAAIAIPSYQDQVRKSRRAEAKANLQDVQMLMERYRVDHPSYGTFTIPAGKNTKYYNLAIAAADATSYTLTATPVSPQDVDTCGTLSLVIAPGSITKLPTTTGCW